MAQPFIAEKGVLRVSPLEKVVAARSNPSSQSSEQRASATPGSKDGNKGLPPGVDEQDVVEAQAKAEAGDQTAIAWLKGLGIAVGTAATAYGVHRVLSSRKKKTLPQMGADDIAATAASPNATTAVAKKTKSPTLYVDGPIPPEFDDATRFAPAMEARKTRQEVKGKEFLDFYEARRARAAMKAVRMLP